MFLSLIHTYSLAFHGHNIHSGYIYSAGSAAFLSSRRLPRGLFAERLRCLKKPSDTVGESTSWFEKYLFLCKFPKLFCLPRRHMRGTNFGTLGVRQQYPEGFRDTTKGYLADCPYIDYVKNNHCRDCTVIAETGTIINETRKRSKYYGLSKLGLSEWPRIDARGLPRGLGSP